MRRDGLGCVQQFARGGSSSLLLSQQQQQQQEAMEAAPPQTEEEPSEQTKTTNVFPHSDVCICVCGAYVCVGVLTVGGGVCEEEDRPSTVPSVHSRPLIDLGR